DGAVASNFIKTVVGPTLLQSNRADAVTWSGSDVSENSVQFDGLQSLALNSFKHKRKSGVGTDYKNPSPEILCTSQGPLAESYRKGGRALGSLTHKNDRLQC